MSVKFLSQIKVIFKKNGSGWCDSVDWVLACEAKSHWLDSQSGHMHNKIEKQIDVSLSLFLSKINQ